MSSNFIELGSVLEDLSTRAVPKQEDLPPPTTGSPSDSSLYLYPVEIMPRLYLQGLRELHLCMPKWKDVDGTHSEAKAFEWNTRRELNALRDLVNLPRVHVTIAQTEQPKGSNDPGNVGLQRAKAFSAALFLIVGMIAPSRTIEFTCQ